MPCSTFQKSCVAKSTCPFYFWIKFASYCMEQMRRAGSQTEEQHRASGEFWKQKTWSCAKRCNKTVHRDTNTQCIPSLIHQPHKFATVILCSFTALPTCFGSSLSGEAAFSWPLALSLCHLHLKDFYKKPLKPPLHPVLCFWLLSLCFLKALKLG